MPDRAIALQPTRTHLTLRYRWSACSPGWIRPWREQKTTLECAAARSHAQCYFLCWLPKKRSPQHWFSARLERTPVRWQESDDHQHITIPGFNATPVLVTSMGCGIAGLRRRATGRTVVGASGLGIYLAICGLARVELIPSAIITTEFSHYASFSTTKKADSKRSTESIITLVGDATDHEERSYLARDGTQQLYMQTCQSTKD